MLRFKFSLRGPGLLPTALLVLAALSACGDRARETIEQERRTAGLVVGSAAGEWGLLTLPRGGGTPDLRPIVDPDSVTWNGAAELPALRGAWPLEGAVVVLLSEAGELLRYDPVADHVTTLATLSGEAEISGASQVAAVFLDSAGRYAYEIGADYAHGYDLPRAAAWAGPIDGGIAVLSTDSAGPLVLLQRADSSASATLEGAGGPPALVTAWGRRVAVTGPDGGSVRVYSTEPEPRLVGEAPVQGPVRTMASSPSSHEIYVVHGTPARVSALSRFSFETREIAELPSSGSAIRPGLFGGSLLVRTESGPVRIRTGDDEAAPLPGTWRSDLPLGLPGDLSIVLVDDEARLGSAIDSSAAVLAGGEPRWWLPVRFNPTASGAESLQEALDELGAEAGVPGDEPVTGDVSGEGGGREDVDVPQIGQEAAAAQEGPPGYYAIVASTRQRQGVESLLATLSEAGYPTRIQTYPDEAGEQWHRGLVGPFPSRARAQAAARQLLRERDLQAWVTEIGDSE